MERDILRAQHHDIGPKQAQNMVQAGGDCQIHMALHVPRLGDRSSVLAAMACVNDHRLRPKAPRMGHRLYGPSRP